MKSDLKPRRWLQFSLRTLFVLMLVVAAFFGGRESMRPVIEAERAKATLARAQAELQRAQALANVAQMQAFAAATQAEVDRVLARSKDASATEGGAPDSFGMP